MRINRMYRPVIKIIANLTKICCYGFHVFFPKKRFRLPTESGPIVASRPGAETFQIPRIIWQTNYTRDVSLPVYLNYLFNRLMSPSFSYRFMVTDERSKYIRENFSPEVFRAYNRLQIGAAQADFWRLLILQKIGGVYMDIDAHLVRPLSSIIKPDDSELFLKTKTGEISNYFIASKPDHPSIKAIATQVQNNIVLGSSDNVYDLTGPGVFNSVLNNSRFNAGYYLDVCNQGNFTNEYFQYIDKPQGKWTKEQSKVSVIREDSSSS